MPMTVFVAKYYISEGKFIVTNVFDRRSTLISPGNYAHVEPMAAVEINNHLRDKNLVTILSKEKAEEGEKLGVEDFLIEEVSEFEKKKTDVVNEVHTDLTDLPLLMSTLDVLEFILTFCRFAEKGVFIWGDKVEESYLEILNTGDEKLIDELERYLELKDKVKAVVRKFQNVQKAEKLLRNAEDKKQLDAILKTYKGSDAN